MVKHINNLPLEMNLKHRKMEKMVKLFERLNSLNNLPLQVHKLGLIWLDLCWRKVVFENGFKNIDLTLHYIEIDNLHFEENSDSEFINEYEFTQYHKENIVPINCQISRLENKNTGIKLCLVRPSLPEFEGKLYGLCVELYQPEFTLRIFGLVDSDPFRVYRDKIPKDILLKELQDNDIDEASALRFLRCVSYRDYLVLNNNQIINKIKN